jgi:hypothetical protein
LQIIEIYNYEPHTAAALASSLTMRDDLADLTPEPLFAACKFRRAEGLCFCGPISESVNSLSTREAWWPAIFLRRSELADRYWQAVDPVVVPGWTLPYNSIRDFS